MLQVRFQSLINSFRLTISLRIWNEEDMTALVPRISVTAFQSVLVNLVSRSLMNPRLSP
jgi:hypothetical protein